MWLGYSYTRPVGITCSGFLRVCSEPNISSGRMLSASMWKARCVYGADKSSKPLLGTQSTQRRHDPWYALALEKLLTAMLPEQLQGCSRLSGSSSCRQMRQAGAAACCCSTGAAATVVTAAVPAGPAVGAP